MFRKTKLVLAGTVVVAGTCAGCYVYGQVTAGEKRLKELEASNEMQKQYIEQLKAQDIKYEKFVKQVSNETELVLFTEEGITNTVIDKGSNIFTHTETEFAIEYRVKLNLKTSHISYMKGEETINVIINRDDIEVGSIEVLNKNILKSSPKLFSKYMTEDEKIAAEKLILDKAKEEVLKNNENINMAIDGFTEYMNGIANICDVDINIIIH